MKFDQISTLASTELQAFCTGLWFELTIAGRSIWSESKYECAEQLNALKSLNEIQHRVWNVYMTPTAENAAFLVDRIETYCQEAPNLRFHVGVALERSLNSVLAAQQIVPADARSARDG